MNELNQVHHSATSIRVCIKSCKNNQPTFHEDTLLPVGHSCHGDTTHTQVQSTLNKYTSFKQ